MSQKVMLAVAATAVLAATTAEAAYPPHGRHHFPHHNSTIVHPKHPHHNSTVVPHPKPHHPRPHHNATKPYHKFPKQKLHVQKPVAAVALDEDEEEEVQKIKWGKVLKGVNTGLDLLGKAKGVGLFDEDEEEYLESGLPKRCLYEKSAFCAGFGQPIYRTITYDEEEGNNYWELNGGASNGGNWNIGGKIGGTFDEDEATIELQKIKLSSALKKATTVLVKANDLGLLEEDADLDETQKLKLGKVLGGALKVVKVAGAVGLLEEEEELQKTNVLDALDKALDLYGKAKQVGLFDEEEGNNYWELNGGASNGGNWNIGGKIGGTFDEESSELSLEELQKIKWGKVVHGLHTALDLAHKAHQVGLFEEDEELQKINWKKVVGGLDKALDIAGKAKSVGLFDEEDEVQKIKWGKVLKGINTGLDLLGKAKGVGLFDEEELAELQQVNWFKVGQGLHTALKLAGKAHHAGLFDEEEGNNYWELNGGASNGGNWNIGGKIGGTFDEEELLPEYKIQPFIPPQWLRQPIATFDEQEGFFTRMWHKVPFFGRKAEDKKEVTKQ